MTAGFLILLPTVLGLAAWLPATLPAGARLFLGAVALPLLLHLGGDLAGLPLSRLAWLIAGGAGLGLARGIHHMARRGPPAVADLIHPALVLPAALLVLLAVRGSAGYLPHSWDEFSNWLYWARQAFAADAAWGADLYFSTTGYTQGWPLALAYPQVFFGSFDEARAVPLAFLLHSGLLGVLYDGAVAALAGARSGSPGGVPDDGTGVPRPRRWAWLMVLLLAAAEAFWKLLPESLLIDEPLTQALAGAFALLLLATAAAGPPQRRHCVVAAGIAAAAAYALKTAAITALPALALAALLLGRSWRERLGLAAAAVLPLLALHLAWSVANPAAPTCAPPLLQALLTDLPGPGGTLLRTVGHHFAADSLAFLTGYKLPLTVLAVAGLVLALPGRRAAGAVAVLVFAGAFAGALWLSYAYCFSGYEQETLASLSRYLRAPVRIAHGLGLALLFCQGVTGAHRAGPARLVPRLPARLGRAGGPAVAALLLAVVAGLAALQARAVARSLDHLATRADETPADIERVRALKAGTAAVAAALDQAGLARPRLVLITQGGDGSELVIVRYYALTGRALAGRPGPSLRRFQLSDRFSWGPVAANVWMHAATPEAVRAELTAADAIWPWRLDPWMAGILAGLTVEAGCPATLDGTLLVRAPGRPGRFECRML